MAPLVQVVMTRSHRSLARRFENGETSGKSSSMSIMELDDGYTALVGYGHAVYAVKKDNCIVRFDGWHFKNARRYSGTTTVKSNHFPAFSTVGDIRVAYTDDKADSESRLKERADIVDDDATFAAPKVRNAKEAFQAAKERVANQPTA